MGKLSDLVSHEYDEEVKLVSETGGRLWPKWIGLSVALGVFMGLGLLIGDRWSKRDIGFGMIFVIVFPFLERAWERYKVAAEMRHHREVRVEMKLNALLGIANIQDSEE